MKFSIGDKVSFVNERMEGIVSSIIDVNTVGVTVDNDFEIPALLNQIVRISFDDFQHKASKAAEVEVKTADKGFDENMYASFVQFNEQQMELYFINHTKHILFLNYYTKKEGIATTKFFQTIGAFDYRSIDKLAMAEFANWDDFYFQVLVKPEAQEFAPITKQLQIPASRFFKHLRATPLLQKQGYIFLINEALDDDSIIKLATYSHSEERKVEKAPTILAPLALIDLHIDKIHNNYTQLTKQETMQFQLTYFEKNLENAIASNMRKVTFIHGVGNLKLKNEIIKILKQKTGIHEIKDAPTNEFGYGATEVYFSVS